MSSLPWVLGGDFNEILHRAEKSGGQNRLSSSMAEFIDTINQCELIDLGYDGPPFTWSNKQVPPNLIQERLDRVLVSLKWRNLFPEAHVTHREFYGSDHRMLQLDISQPLNAYSLHSSLDRPFRFDPCWRMNGQLRQILEDFWLNSRESFSINPKEFMTKLDSCGKFLKSWGQSTFGNLKRKISRLQNDITHINSHPLDPRKTEVQRMESDLDKLLALEEAYWKQREDWLAEGDRNTKFFHHKANVRQRNNKIHGIMSGGNDWITNDTDMETVILDYFQNLFTTSHPSVDVIEQGLVGVDRRISDDMSSHLNAPFDRDEVRVALFGLSPWKAPGPDGYHAGFFQENWDLIGDQFVGICLNVLNGQTSLGDLNKTLMVLIPKKKNPRSVSDFRPISLCTVLAKVVAKSMANRLKRCLDDIIDLEHSAFIPGRLITISSTLSPYPHQKLFAYFFRRRLGGLNKPHKIHCSSYLKRKKAYFSFQWMS